MIITRTPFRLSFLGGGSDYPQWYSEHVGMVLGATIDRYCYITLQPDQERYRILYSKLEEVDYTADIQHPAARACLVESGTMGPCGLFHASDLPARSGIGSSSAYVVGLLNAIYASKGVYKSQRELAAEAINIEQVTLGEPVGSQDQILTACGGLKQITFHQTGYIGVRQIDLPVARLAEFRSHLMLFQIGPRVAESPSPLNFDIDITRRLATMAKEGADLLTSNAPISDFGFLLDEGWQLKKQMSDSISNHTIDDAYRLASSLGAIGGKLLGAGGGGFLLLFTRPEHHTKLATSMGLEQIEFNFESEGTKVIYES